MGEARKANQKDRLATLHAVQEAYRQWVQSRPKPAEARKSETRKKGKK